MSKIGIIYWSGTGNTETMAEAIKEGVANAGADVELFSVDAFSGSINDYDGLILGCPACGDEELDDGEFEPFFNDNLENLSGKKVAIFGSYEWNEGEWIKVWANRCKEAGIELFKGEGLKVYSAPEDEHIEECKAFGEEFVGFIG